MVSNVAPAQTVAVQTAHEAGEVAEAARRMRQLLPLVDFLFADTNPVPCKAILAAMGHCRAEVRLPLCASSDPVPAHLLSEWA